MNGMSQHAASTQTRLLDSGVMLLRIKARVDRVRYGALLYETNDAFA